MDRYRRMHSRPATWLLDRRSYDSKPKDRVGVAEPGPFFGADMKTITRQDAEIFYARAFAICHSPDFSHGRSLILGAHDPVAVEFNIQTQFGLLKVSVNRDEWIRRLGFSIALRFVERPAIYPVVGGLDYDKNTGKWNIVSPGPAGADSVLAELSRRLEWAQRGWQARPTQQPATATCVTS